MVAKSYNSTASLYKAAENLRNFFFTSKTFEHLSHNPQLNEKLINLLASKHTGGSIIEASLALATRGAQSWLAQKIEDHELHFNEKFKCKMSDAVQTFKNDTFNFLFFAYPNKPSIVKISQFVRGPWGSTLLMEAGMAKNNYVFTQLLKEKQAFINECNQKRQSVLSKMAECGNIFAIQILLQAGADANHRSVPLAEAICFGHHHIVKILLDHGADPNNPSADNPDISLLMAKRMLISKENFTIPHKAEIIALLKAAGATF